jgi:capsule polysaccharide export protein KpsE/RkpR
MDHRNTSVIEPQLQPEVSPNESMNSLGANPNTTLARLELLWDNRRLLLRCALWGLLVSTIIAFLIPAKYDSVTQLMPPDSDSGGAALLTAMADKGGGLLSSYAGNLLGIKNSGDLFIGILQSRTVEDALIRKFDLRKVYWVRRWEDARKELQDRTSIAEDRKSGIIRISVLDHSPQRAQAMAQAYVDQLNIAVSTLSTSSARRERIFLETRLKAVKQDLDQAEKNFGEFASKNTAIDIEAQGKAMVDAAARLQGQLIAAQAQLQGLEQIYAPNNARVRAARANVDELQRQLDKLGSAGVSGGGVPTPDSSSSSSSIYPSIRELPLLGVTYADLYRRTKIEETVYEALTKQYELAKVEEAKEIPTVKVLDPPSYPEKKAFPPRALLIMIGILLAGFYGMLWILSKSYWEQVDPADPTKIFITKVICESSAFWRKRDSKWRLWRHW